LNFRLVVMPLVVTFFALRAAMRDARAGRPLYFRTLLLKPAERPRLIRSGLKDVGKILLMAVVLDTTSQILVFKVFHLEELLVVVMVSAILPYFVVRSAGSILMRRVYREHPKATGQSPPNPKEEPSDRPAPPSNTGL
ncbi:MAG: hypothetical protein NT154_20925, partial [Verrucomicrobia bacterium]|nr:hypothetical protein [Verrucomicrobiota bacterium]